MSKFIIHFISLNHIIIKIALTWYKYPMHVKRKDIKTPSKLFHIYIKISKLLKYSITSLNKYGTTLMVSRTTFNHSFLLLKVIKSKWIIIIIICLSWKNFFFSFYVLVSFHCLSLFLSIYSWRQWHVIFMFDQENQKEKSLYLHF